LEGLTYLARTVHHCKEVTGIKQKILTLRKSLIQVS
jgi:hypothetical protein